MVIDDSNVSANIWDTAGQEKLSNCLSKQFYRGSDACVIVFDITDKSSFTEVQTWLDGFLLHTASRMKSVQLIPSILVGNKIDLSSKRVVSADAATELANNLGICKYYETSAKDLIGVDDAFNYIIKKAIDALPFVKPPMEIIKGSLSMEVKQNTNSSCC